MTVVRGITHARSDRTVKGEDATSVAVLFFADGPPVQYFAVFDGHGGAAAAKLCAEELHGRVVHAFERNAPGEAAGDFDARLGRACTQAFDWAEDVLRKAHSSHGTTATCVFVAPDAVYVANVGDSAAFLFTPDGERRVLIKDHRVDECSPRERERVIAGGGEIRPARNMRGVPHGPARIFPGGLMMTRSVGDMGASATIIATPAVQRFDYPRDGGTIVLASDGLWDFVPLELIDGLVRASAKPTLGVRWLSQALLKVAKHRNADLDDVSIVCITLDAKAEPRRRSWFGAPAAVATSPEREWSSSPSLGVRSRWLAALTPGSAKVRAEPAGGPTPWQPKRLVPTFVARFKRARSGLSAAASPLRNSAPAQVVGGSAWCVPEFSLPDGADSRQMPSAFARQTSAPLCAAAVLHPEVAA
ncbi:hypothetical protein KFE25_013511 [Diacronema lutheri]|uniref:PPM-type phosphatase domain-containing protein n=1 Tax=Diacronema lutheri TaxID=2081491 RepID=A0A8J6CI46_DIALT|nr:hypothetical protein KFE25_013511 [Diacronema lutheri]